MNRLLTFLLMSSLVFGQGWAQTTFNVDMTCAPEGFDNVFVTGPWCGWCANDTYNTMTDPDGDGVYTVEVPDLTGLVEYKYAINGFADQENLVNDMVEGATCAPITDYSAYANRQIDAGSVANDDYGTCSGICNDIPPPPGGTVVFRVDMSEYAESYGTVNLNGSFNGWCGSCATMTDDDGDMIYELAVDLPGGTTEYKFTLDGWNIQEEFTDGDPCTSNLDGYINRTIEVTGDVVLPAVCWNSCTGCASTAQCDPDFDFGGAEMGSSPQAGEGFMLAYTESSYYDTWHYIAPASAAGIDSTYPLTLPVDSLIILENSVDGMGVLSGVVFTDVVTNESFHPEDIGFEVLVNNNGDSPNEGTLLGGNQYCTTIQGVPIRAGLYNVTVDAQMWATIFSPFNAPVTFDFLMQVFDSNAPGCTDMLACNFDANALLDDGTCEYAGPFVDCNGNCLLDENGDGVCEAARTILFQVDMSNEDISPFGVHVAGSFQGWDPGATELFDVDGDMVYERTYAVPESVNAIEYKFINGSDWTDMIESNLGDCANELDNRTLTLVDGLNVVSDDEGSVYCFNSCSACVVPLAVTFTVDMSAVDVVSESGVHLAGSFQGWDPAGTPMSDNGDGTWSVTLELQPGTYEFEFINGNNWGPDEALNGTSCENGSGSRMATFEGENETYEACFNDCPGEPCVPDPDPAEVTFRLNTIELNLGVSDIPYVWGSFTGWQGGAIAMTDMDADGIWEHTETISGGTNVDYKYSIGHPEDEGMIEESGEYVTDEGLTNFEDAGCGAANGFGGFNRRVIRTGEPQILDVVCFNSCEACADILGCTNLAACNYNPQATVDDGSCVAACGCTDPNACNYDANAMADDGSCCTCVESVHPLGLLNRTWRFSPEEGAIAIGPEPLSTEWYSAPAGSLVDFQYDDRWTFTPFGTMVYDNNGSTMNPFDGYIETTMTVAPTTFTYSPSGPFLGGPAITISPLTTEDAMMCGWLGVWDSGPTYEVVELTDSTLVVLALQQTGDCTNPLGSGIFTLKFVAAEAQDVAGTDGATDGICITGCLDPNACNYSPLAEYDSGNCDYECFGCTDVEAFNYNAEASLNDGSCFYASCDDLGNPLWAANADIGLHVPSTETLVHGIGVSTQWVLNLPTVIEEPSSEQLFATYSWSDLVLAGLPVGLTPDTAGVELSLAGSEQACVAIAGVPELPGTYDVQVQGVLMVSVFGAPFEIGLYTATTSVTVYPNPNPIPGCTYEGAANFAGYANLENGTCVYAGCTDPEALNYYSFITLDDGSCLFGDVVGAACPSDIDQDGAVTTSDLLTLLSTFGLECE